MLYRSVKIRRVEILTSSATAGWITTDYSGKSKTSEVEAESMVIVFSQKLRVHLADTVDGAGSLDRDVWRRIPRRVRTERADRRRNENSQLVLFRQFDDIVHTCSEKLRGILKTDERKI